METPAGRPIVTRGLDDSRWIPCVRTSLGADRSMPLSHADREGEGRGENSRTQHAMQGRPGENAARHIAYAYIRKALRRNGLFYRRGTYTQTDRRSIEATRHSGQHHTALQIRVCASNAESVEYPRRSGGHSRRNSF